MGSCLSPYSQDCVPRQQTRQTCLERALVGVNHPSSVSSSTCSPPHSPPSTSRCCHNAQPMCTQQMSPVHRLPVPSGCDSQTVGVVTTTVCALRRGEDCVVIEKFMHACVDTWEQDPRHLPVYIKPGVQNPPTQRHPSTARERGPRAVLNT